MEIITEQILHVKLVFKEQLPKINLRNVPYHRLIVECFEILSRNGFEWLQFKYKLHKNWLASLLSILFYLYHFFQSAEIQKIVPSFKCAFPSRLHHLFNSRHVQSALFKNTKFMKREFGSQFSHFNYSLRQFYQFFRKDDTDIWGNGQCINILRVFS